MKKILLYVAAVSIIAACSKENPFSDERPVDNKPAGGTEMTIQASVPVMQSATKADAIGTFSWAENDAIAIPVEGGYVEFVYDSAKDAFTYSPSGSETFIDGTAYYPASSIPGGSYSTDFSSPAAAKAGFKMEAPYTVGSTSLDFTHKSAMIKLSFTDVPATASSVRAKAGDAVIATVALSSPASNLDVYIPITPSGSQTYTFALMQNDIVLKEVGKSSASLTAGTYYTSKSVGFAITELYLLGGATDYGWDISAMPALTVSGSVFSIETNLSAYGGDSGNRFRFPLQKVAGTWWPCLVKGAADGTVRIADSDADQVDQFTVDTDGYYSISIDVSAMTYSITRLGNKRYNITELYLNGDACDAGWNNTGAAPLTKNGNVFSVTANLYSGKSFRLNTQNTDWWPSIVKETASGEPVYCASQSVWDTHSTVWSHFSVSEDGSYEIEFDADAWTLTLTRKGDVTLPPLAVSELYLIGGATDYGWDIPSMPAFTKAGDVFTLRAHLKANQIFRFLTQKVAGTWYPAIVKGGVAGTVKLANDATDPEHFTVDTEGMYDITVNVATREYSIDLVEADVWYIIGSVYDDDSSVGAWSKDFALTNTTGRVWSITINITGEFLFRKYYSFTPDGDKWNEKLGLRDAGTLYDGNDYDLLYGGGGANIGIGAAGRYTLTIDLDDNNMLHLTKLD